MSSKRKNEVTEQTKSHTIAIIVSLIMIIPFIWMILSSFKPGTEIVKMPPSFILHKLFHKKHSKGAEAS